jgi:hypothetical protein
VEVSKLRKIVIECSIVKKIVRINRVGLENWMRRINKVLVLGLFGRINHTGMIKNRKS